MLRVCHHYAVIFGDNSYDPRISLRGSGPPLVCVPGMDGTGNLFYRQVPGLAQRFRVATYALRDEASEMKTLTADLADIVRHTAGAPQPAVIVGESFGGTVAMSLALERPELVRALVVINSFPRFLPQHRLRLAIRGVYLFPWKAMTLVRRLTAARLHSHYTHREEIHRFLDLTKATTRRGYVNRLRILRQYDIRSRLPEISVPTLLLAAEEDHLVPSVQQAQYMTERIPGATVRVLAGHGHICLIAPGVDLSAILDQWEGIEGS